MICAGKKTGRFSAALALLATLAGLPAWAQETLTVVSWGGVYEAAQRAALFEPFTAETGIEIEALTYGGGLPALERRAKAERWDLVDMFEDEAIAACEAGLLRPIEPEAVAVVHPEAGLETDFLPGAFRDCSLAQNVFATVMAYDQRAFPGLKPVRVEDFFDLDRFPGKRAVERSPDLILEWALLAEGVPAGQIYDLLSTDRGLRLAFRKLDTIRDAIVWWEDVARPAEMLRDGEASMAMGYNGRFFAMARDQGAPITLVWDGRIIGYDVWAIPASSQQPELAERFLRFATQPEQLASLAELIPYGPARNSALQLVGLHPNTNIPMKDQLPNAPQHGPRFLIRDSTWYAHTEALRQRRFDAWLAESAGG